MTFKNWLKVKNLTDTIIDELISLLPDDIGEEPDDCFYDADSIIGANDPEEGIPIDRTSGFIIVGTCPNGDIVAIDTAEEVGAVFYISCSEMFSDPTRDVSVKVAGSPKEYVKMYGKEGFPWDYWEAVNQ